MEYTFSILVIEDDPNYQEYYQKWLADRNYYVKICGTLDDVQRTLGMRYFDVAIIDMNLGGDIQGGMKVLREIQEMGDYSGCVVISADVTREDVRDAAEKFNASVLFKTELDKDGLILAVEQATKKIPAFRYGEESLYKNLIKEKRLTDEKDNSILKFEDDFEALLRKIFIEFWPFNVNLPIESKLIYGLRGERLLQISGWSRGVGGAIVMRMGARRIVEKESHAYNKYIKDLEETVVAFKKGPFYHKILGGLVYVFPDVKFEPVRDFAHFYETESDSRIQQVVKNIFRTAEKIYGSRGRDVVTVDLGLVYKPIIEDAFSYQKRKSKGGGRILEQIGEGEHESLLRVAKVDPVEFLLEQKQSFVFENVPVGIVHGDLSSNNIIVTSDARTQLLGFCFTGESDVAVSKSDESDSVSFRARQIGKRNLLHDYATLEVSIRRALANIVSNEIEKFNRVLCESDELGKASSFQIEFSNPQLKKAYSVIANLRKQAGELVEFKNSMWLYNSELFFQFVNIYLFSPNHPEKENAYYSASILAERLANSYFAR